VRATLPSTRHHTNADDALADNDAVAVAGLIRDRQLSAGEVVRAAIARAENAGPIGAIVATTFDVATAQADRLDQATARLDGAFAGVPMFIKDQIDVIGVATKYGSEAHANAAPAKKHDRVAQQLFTMGLISLGKSTLPEYGFTPSTEFPNGEPTRNPWNLARTAGGSSGGSAALVAAGVVPIAHAADGGGSIRIPAACCGLVGLKPSRGRIPKSGMNEPFVGAVTDGVITRSVRDTAAYVGEVERLTPNRKLPPVGRVHDPLNRPLRVGVVRDPPLGIQLDAATERELASTIQLLTDLGHEVETVELPVGQQFAEDFEVFWSMLGALVALTAKRAHDPTFDKTKLAEFTRGLGVEARSSRAAIPGAIRRLRRTAVGAATFFQQIDVVLTPTTAQRTPLLGELRIDQPVDVLFPKLKDWACFTPWANACGVPSISLPLGFDEESSLPIGMLFTAAAGQDRLLLELALQLEAAKPFQHLPQPLPVSG